MLWLHLTKHKEFWGSQWKLRGGHFSRSSTAACLPGEAQTQLKRSGYEHEACARGSGGMLGFLESHAQQGGKHGPGFELDYDPRWQTWAKRTSKPLRSLTKEPSQVLPSPEPCFDTLVFLLRRHRCPSHTSSDELRVRVWFPGLWMSKARLGYMRLWSGERRGDRDRDRRERQRDGSGGREEHE